MRLRNARLLDLATGLTDEPGDLFVAHGRLVRAECPTSDGDVDLAGRIVMPGLWDAHLDLFGWAATLGGQDHIARATGTLNQLGVVGVTDMGAGALRAWEEPGADIGRLRVRASVATDLLDEALGRDLFTGRQLGGLAAVGPLAVPSAAAIDDLAGLLERATLGGLDVAVGARSSAEVHLAVEAMAASGARGSIERPQVVDLDDAERMAALGIRASVQPGLLPEASRGVEAQCPQRAGDTLALATLRATGVELVLGSDAPPAWPNPWLAIAEAVLRERDGDVWHPEQRISLSAALQASTNRVARLVPGAHADLVVLDASPFDVDPEHLAGYGAWMTMVAGQIVHQC